MDFAFTSEQQMLRDTARDFAKGRRLNPMCEEGTRRIIFGAADF